MSPTWDDAADWDAAASEQHVHHEQPTGSGWKPAGWVERGYGLVSPPSSLYSFHGLNNALDDLHSTNDATVGGGSPTGSSSGGPGDFGYYDFDGVDDWLEVDDNLSTGDAARAVAMWIYPRDISDANGVGSFMFTSGSGNCTGRQFGMRFRSDDLAYWSGCDGHTFTSLTGTENAWQFVAMRHDGAGNLKAWLDSSTATTSINPNYIGGSIRFGWGSSSQDKYYDGRIGAVWVFDGNPSDAEIEACRFAFVGQGASLITAEKTL